MSKSGAPGRRSGGSQVIRYAVIGLGYISQVAVLPAFANAKRNSKLAALVSDDDEKLEKLGRRYRVQLLCKYADVEKLFTSGAIDAVYIALPNSLHCEYAEKATRVGLHVLCEKPLAVTSDECHRMTEAARQNRVKLIAAYRLHFDAATLEIAGLAQSGKLGELRYFTSQFSQQVGQGNIRLQRETGGGPLYDIGIYCINVARMIFAAEPTEVLATAVSHDDRRFKEVPETTSVVMKFPRNMIATFTCSFGAARRSVYEIVGTEGSITAEPGYEFSKGVSYRLRIGDKERVRRSETSDQFAPELLYFSDCILNDREPEPSGEEGSIDVRIIEALNASILGGKWVALKLTRTRRPTKDQAISRPGLPPPKLVGAKSPSSSILPRKA